MTDNTRSRLILAGLVAAHVVLHLVALAVLFKIHWPLPGTWPGELLFDALLMLGPSQGTLLGLWLALGGGRLLWRVVPSALGVVAYVWLFQTAGEPWLTATLGQVCVWGVLLLVARVTGLELVQSSSFRSDSRRSQFYIRDMLGWMTALAVILSAMRYLPMIWLLDFSILEAICFLWCPALSGRRFDSLRPGRKMAACTDRAYAAGGRCGAVRIRYKCGWLV